MIKYLKDVSRTEVNLFGNKATNLGYLIQKGFNVPEGFCISTGITNLSEDIKETITKYFHKLNSPVSIRSSSTSEDSNIFSFAGQFDSYVNISTTDDLFSSVIKCWDSVNSERVQEYIRDKEIMNWGMAVIIQKMVNADFSGVMFTLDPIDERDILIEAAPGLGENIVSGKISPSNFYVNRTMFYMDKKEDIHNIDDEIIIKVAQLGMRIEEVFNRPQDVEFSVEDNKIYFLQSRPITT